MGKYWIINMKSKTYIETENENFDGDWKEKYPHTVKADWLDVEVVKLFDDQQTANGIYYLYDLCPNGGLFGLYVDVAQHGKREVADAKAELRRNHDVVKLRVVKVRKSKGREDFRDYYCVGIFKYRIKSTGHNSERYGPCEVCKKHVGEVFLQTEQKQYIDSETGGIGYTFYGCKDYRFGHKACLISKRRKH